jgi:hypothetical protein
MLQEPLFRKNLLAMRAAIKGFSAESVSLTKKKAKKTTALEKNALAMDKVYLGFNTRAHNLAYAFLRGLDYKDVERTSSKVFSATERSRIWAIAKLYGVWKTTYLTEDCIEKWIAGERFFLTKEEMNAKYLERQAKWAKRLEGQRQC